MNQVTARFYRLGGWLSRHRVIVVVVWALILAIGFWGSRYAPDVLKGSAAGIPNSSSARAADLLQDQFQNPYQFSFLVTITSDKQTVTDAGFQAEIRDFQQAVAKESFVNRTFSYLDHADDTLRSPDGHRTFFLVGLKAKDNLHAEQMVMPVREALAPLISRYQAQDSSLRVYVTGETPIGYDSIRVLMKDTATAEHRIIPIAILFLLLAFGALAAAGIPVLAGSMATVITLSLLVLVGLFTNVSSMSQNISSMVGLGVGIDYSLIIVSRFREALAKGLEIEQAVAETTATAGQAVVYSGVTVMIGFLALFLPNLIDINGIALAGSLTVMVSVAIALTLLPAVLSFCGKWVDWPFAFSRWINRFDGNKLWLGWANTVMRYRFPFLIGGTLLLLAMSLPMFTIKFGQFEAAFIPQGMESGRGMAELMEMHQAGQLYPISIVVHAKTGQKVFTPDSLKALAGVVRNLKAEPRVENVHSIVENASTLILMDNLFFRGDVSALRKRFPEAASLLISEDGTGTVIQVIPRSSDSFAQIKDLTRSLEDHDWSKDPGMANFDVAVGGAAAVNNDFEHAILSNLPRVIALVFIVTFALLYLSFRSVLLPIKALLMNTLSVSASLGALVLVFQHGFLSWMVGFPTAPGVIIVVVPIIAFCSVFGLSMDYEVFLLSRIKEIYEETGDSDRAVAEGLAATGGIITNAALIMLLVFGAFVAADVILTKMIGFALAMAVLVDALVIRVMLVPSFMAIAGTWNWWPNIVPPKAVAHSRPQDELKVPT